MILCFGVCGEGEMPGVRGEGEVPGVRGEGEMPGRVDCCCTGKNMQDAKKIIGYLFGKCGCCFLHAQQPLVVVLCYAARVYACKEQGVARREKVT